MKVKLFFTLLLIVGLLVGCNSNTSGKSESEQVSKYANTMKTYVNDLNGSMEQLTELNNQINGAPFLLDSNAWKSDVMVEMEKMKNTISNVRAVKAPNSMKKVHTLMLKAMKELSFVTTMYPIVFDQKNTDFLDECQDHLERYSDYTDQALSEILSSKWLK